MLEAMQTPAINDYLEQLIIRVVSRITNNQDLSNLGEQIKAQTNEQVCGEQDNKDYCLRQVHSEDSTKNSNLKDSLNVTNISISDSENKQDNIIGDSNEVIELSNVKHNLEQKITEESQNSDCESLESKTNIEVETESVNKVNEDINSNVKDNEVTTVASITDISDINKNKEPLAKTDDEVITSSNGVKEESKDDSTNADEIALEIVYSPTVNNANIDHEIITQIEDEALDINEQVNREIHEALEKEIVDENKRLEVSVELLKKAQSEFETLQCKLADTDDRVLQCEDELASKTAELATCNAVTSINGSSESRDNLLEKIKELTYKRDNLLSVQKILHTKNDKLQAEINERKQEVEHTETKLASLRQEQALRNEGRNVKLSDTVTNTVVPENSKDKEVTNDADTKNVVTSNDELQSKDNLDSIQHDLNETELANSSTEDISVKLFAINSHITRTKEMLMNSCLDSSSAIGVVDDKTSELEFGKTESVVLENEVVGNCSLKNTAKEENLESLDTSIVSELNLDSKGIANGVETSSISNINLVNNTKVNDIMNTEKNSNDTVASEQQDLQEKRSNILELKQEITKLQNRNYDLEHTCHEQEHLYSDLECKLMAQVQQNHVLHGKIHALEEQLHHKDKELDSLHQKYDPNHVQSSADDNNRCYVSKKVKKA